MSDQPPDRLEMVIDLDLDVGTVAALHQFTDSLAPGVTVQQAVGLLVREGLQDKGYLP